MNGAAPGWLAQLAPAHAPPPSGWWPLAPGWWGLLALTLLVVAGIAFWQTRPIARLRRNTLRELDVLRTTSNDDYALAQLLENLLRRYAVARFGRTAVANLSGERWIDFIAAHGGRALSGATGNTLLRAAYGSTVVADRNAWLDGARAFLKDRK